jgi:hypothetical protein
VSQSIKVPSLFQIIMVVVEIDRSRFSAILLKKTLSSMPTNTQINSLESISGDKKHIYIYCISIQITE